MSARDGTGKFVKKAEADAKKAKPDQVTFEPQGRDPITPTTRATLGAGANPAMTAQSMAEQYPTGGLNAADDRDRLNELKYALQKDAQGADTGVTPYGQLTWDDSIGDWLLKKTEAAKAAQFQNWFAANFDKWGDAQKAIALKLYPDFYKQRVTQLHANLDTLRKLTEIKIRGVRSKEDLALKFAAENGMLPMGQLENILHPEGKGDATLRFQRGLLNLNTRFFARQEAGFAGAQFAGSAFSPTTNIPSGNQPNLAAMRGWGVVQPRQ